ncbi:Retinal guanylyl cyclase 2 precursor [Cereibacter sphaeroides KD131]|nr:Retinal guanylyl cyclase 2 precursor [Cereibacter sphaeroides KD131]
MVGNLVHSRLHPPGGRPPGAVVRALGAKGGSIDREAGSIRCLTLLLARRGSGTTDTDPGGLGVQIPRR